MNDTTQQYYDTHAKEYAAATLPARLPDVWRLLTERLKPGSTLLDLGCGAGRDLKYFSEIGYQVVGVDFSKELVEIAERESGHDVILADFRKLPFAADTFDAVLAIASLLHLPPQDLPQTLRAIWTVLRSGGIFVASVKKGVGERVDNKGRFFADYQPQGWRELLEQAGFVEVEIHEMTEHRKSGTHKSRVIDWVVSLSVKK